MAMQTKANAAKDGSKPEGAKPPDKTFTEAEVQARISAVTSTSDKQLTLQTKRAEASAKQVEGLQQDNDRLNARMQVLTKASESVEDATGFADWKAGEETRIEESKRELGRRAMEVTRAELAQEHGVPKEVLMGATSEAEMYRAVLDHNRDNPPVVNPAAAPAESPADSAAPATPANSQEPAPAATPQPDRGGAGNAGGGTPAKGKETIMEGLRQDPSWGTFLDNLPDA